MPTSAFVSGLLPDPEHKEGLRGGCEAGGAKSEGLGGVTGGGRPPPTATGKAVRLPSRGFFRAFYFTNGNIIYIKKKCTSLKQTTLVKPCSGGTSPVTVGVRPAAGSQRGLGSAATDQFVQTTQRRGIRIWQDGCSCVCGSFHSAPCFGASPTVWWVCSAVNFFSLVNNFLCIDTYLNLNIHSK